MRRFSLILTLFFLSATGAMGASPPDWLQPLLSEDISRWSKSESVIRLLDYEKVEFSTKERARKSIRGAVRVLTTAGLARTFAEVTYNADVGRIRSARAWVVSADGKKTTTIARTEFQDTVAQYSTHFWNSSRVMFLPAAGRMETGGVLAWEFVLETESGIFDASQSFLSGEPLISGVFEVHPCPGGKLEWFSTSQQLLTPAAVGAAGGLRWEVNRLDPISNEQPSGFYPDPIRVSVRCVPAGKSERRVKTWEELARLTTHIIEPKIQASPEIAAKAVALTAGRATRWERVRALTEFVQREVTYLSITQDKDTLAGYRPHAASEVLRDRYGDCKDKATLLAALLRSLGDRGHVVLVFAGNPRVVPAAWPSACFNHAISAIPADADTPAWWPTIDGGPLGRLVLFDPTHPVVPLGVLPRSDQGGYGLLVHESGNLVQLPAEDAAHNGVERRTLATFDDRGGLQAEVEEIYLGSHGAGLLLLRERSRVEGFGVRLEERLHQTLPLTQNLKWTDAWDASAARHRLTFSFGAAQHARPLGRDRMVINPQIVAEPTRLEPWKVTHEGVAWQTAESSRDETRLILPEGFTVVEMPDAWSMEIPRISGQTHYRQEGREIVIESKLTRKAGFLEKLEYEAVRAFYQKSRDAARRPLIVQRPSQ